MDDATRALARFIEAKGIGLKKISENTGVPYGRLWPNLTASPSGSGVGLRADDFLAVCSYVGADPMGFNSK